MIQRSVPDCLMLSACHCTEGAAGQSERSILQPKCGIKGHTGRTACWARRYYRGVV